MPLDGLSHRGDVGLYLLYLLRGREKWRQALSNHGLRGGLPNNSAFGTCRRLCPAELLDRLYGSARQPPSRDACGERLESCELVTRFN
jgi:hypothetical protein